MAEYDIILRGGTIVDGMRMPRYVSDLAIKDGNIAKIGGLRHSSADQVLNASGLIVAPGFVDLHTHYDAQIFWDPYCTLSGWHGVTSLVIGNCGFGFAPVEEKDQDRSMLALTRTEAIPFDAMKAGLKWDWVTFPEFMDSLARIPKGVNIKILAPLTPLYGWVMGWDEAKKRRPTQAELKEMCRLLNEAMDAGACGWSAQVLGPLSVQRDYDGTPMITDLMTDEELITFAKVLAEREEGYIELSYQQTGEEGNKLEEPTMRGYERVAEAAQRPVLYQVVAGNDQMPELHRDKIAWLEDCTRRGIRMYGQGSTARSGFELTFEDWNLFDGAPTWIEVTMGTLAERKAKMQDPELRRRLREEWEAGVKVGVGSVEGLVVMETGKREFEEYHGLTIKQIATREEKHVIDALLDMVVADDLQTEFLSPHTKSDPHASAEVMKSPYVGAGTSDGGAHLKFLTAGSYTTDMLAWLVRDEQLLTLEEAHFKMGYMNAQLGGFTDRGYLRESAAADIVVYDLENLKVLPSEIAEDLPGGGWRRVQKAEGYRWIIVNGQVTLEDGQPTGALPGKLLRHGR